jgi:hypothetical protein
MSDMGWSQYIRDQERAAEQEWDAREQDMLPWLAKFCDYDSPHEMYRVFYKYTDCGPWVSVHVDGYWVHCGELHTLGTWDQMIRRGEMVDEILVGSIVEGCDQDADSVPVRLGDLRSPRSKRGSVTQNSVRAAFDRALAEVNASASAIWNDTHGCDTCRAHWAEAGGVDELGQESMAVWPDCPDCGGRGIVI